MRKGNTYGIGAVLGAHSSTIEEESDSGGLFSLAVAEGIHKLFKLRGPLDLEEDLVVIIGDLDV